jgi:hypothetical protein
MLAKRMARHGLAVSGGTLTAVLSHNAVSAWVSPSVVSSTIQAATRVAAGQAAAAGLISVQVSALTEGVLKTMFLNKLKVATTVLLVLALLGVGAGSLRYKGAEPAAPGSPFMPVLLAQKAAEKSALSKEPDLGFYWPDKRLIGLKKADKPRKEADAASKARAKALAKQQAIAAIEASLKKLRENTDEEVEREALDKIERAVLWYKDTRWLTELLSVEKEAVPFPADKKQSEKKK